MIKQKEESPEEAEADSEHKVQGELEVRGHVLAPEEMGDRGHDGDEDDGAEDDQGQDHHVVTLEGQRAMIDSSESKKQEGWQYQNLRRKYKSVSVLHFDSTIITSSKILKARSTHGFLQVMITLCFARYCCV